MAEFISWCISAMQFLIIVTLFAFIVIGLPTLIWLEMENENANLSD